MEMLSSMEKRFAGLLAMLGLRTDDVVNPDQTFGSEQYLAAALLDPAYRDLWVDAFVPIEKRMTVKRRVSCNCKCDKLSLMTVIVNSVNCTICR